MALKKIRKPKLESDSLVSVTFNEFRSIMTYEEFLYILDCHNAFYIPAASLILGDNINLEVEVEAIQ